MPGYHHRLNATRQVEISTCCDNTATEHRMMEKLMSDSVLAWAKHRIDPSADDGATSRVQRWSGCVIA